MAVVTDRSRQVEGPCRDAVVVHDEAMKDGQSWFAPRCRESCERKARFTSPWRKFSGWQTRRGACRLTVHSGAFYWWIEGWDPQFGVKRALCNTAHRVCFYGVFYSHTLCLQQPLYLARWSAFVLFGHREMIRAGCLFVSRAVCNPIRRFSRSKSKRTNTAGIGPDSDAYPKEACWPAT